MKTVRVFFAKEGRLKYISHLDVTRCLARVFKRSRLPIWYTQGFNPHAYLTFALPLPLVSNGTAAAILQDCAPCTGDECGLTR